MQHILSYSLLNLNKSSRFEHMNEWKRSKLSEGITEINQRIFMQ